MYYDISTIVATCRQNPSQGAIHVQMYSRCTVLVATDDYSRTVQLYYRYSCSMATAVLHGYPDTAYRYCMATSSYCTSMATAAL